MAMLGITDMVIIFGGTFLLALATVVFAALFGKYRKP